MKKLIIPIAILILIGGAIGFYLYNKPVERLENKRPEVEVTAVKLVEDYETDEKAANEKYLGKIVQVSGRVAEITNDGGKDKVHLESTNPISFVIAELDEGNKAGGLSAGQEATVKGLCSGYLGDVILVRASLVKD